MKITQYPMGGGSDLLLNQAPKLGIGRIANPEPVLHLSGHEWFQFAGDLHDFHVLDLDLGVAVEQQKQMVVQPTELFLVDHGHMPSFPFDLSKAVTQTVTLGQSKIAVLLRPWLALHDLRVDVALLMQQIQMQHVVQGSCFVDVTQRECEFSFDG